MAVMVIITTTHCGPSHKFTVVVLPEYLIRIDSMAVKPFDTSSRYKRQYAIQLKSMIEGSIAKEGFIDITSNSPIELQGQITFGNMRTDSYSKETRVIKNWKFDTEKVRKCFYTKKMTITGTYRLWNSAQRTTLIGDSFEIDIDKKWSSKDGCSAAKSKAITDEKLIHSALQDIAEQIVLDVSPHHKNVSRKLQTGTDPNIALGTTYLENGRIDQATAIWKQVILQTANQQDKAAAYYNLGVIKESQGAYKDAFELFSNANMIDVYEELYLKALQRIENAQQTRDKLR